MRIGRLAGLLLVAALLVAGCGGADHRADPLVVGSRHTPESTLLAAIYVAALRSYGFAAQAAETAADPMAQLDSGVFTVLPAFTGRTLQALQPGASALSDKQVYRAMVAALPEGIAAGDYTTAAEDKPVLLVTHATAKA